jgi:hypothetical protein
MERKKHLKSSNLVMKTLTDHWVSCCVYVAAKLTIADQLVDAPQHISALALANNCHEGALYRVLRALASNGVFTETTTGTFAMTDTASSLLSNGPESGRSFLLAELGEFYHPWGNLLHSVKTGEVAFDNYYKFNLWQYYNANPEEGVNFNQAMSQLTRYVDKSIIEAYDFSVADTIVDIGGGSGALLSAVLEVAPGSKGILFDQPEVAREAAARFVANGLSDRCIAQGGSFFDAVPAGADLYMMKYILHDWSDENVIRILTSCAVAMKTGSKLLVIDSVIPEDNEPNIGKLMDVNMLVVTGGRERTAVEFDYLFKETGFLINRIIELHELDFNLIETVKI